MKMSTKPKYARNADLYGSMEHHLMYRLFWGVRYEKKKFKLDYTLYAKDLFFDVSSISDNFEISRLGFGPNGIELTVVVHPRESIDGLIKKIKEVSNRKIKEQFPEIDKNLKGKSFWTDGYYAETVDGKLSFQDDIDFDGELQ